VNTDVIAGLVLDIKAGKKVKNIGRFRGKESANTYELQPLLEKKTLDYQRIVGMPKNFHPIMEETEKINDDPVQSQITEFKTPSNIYDNSNSLKLQDFKNFLDHDQTCKDLGISFKEIRTEIKYNLNFLPKYQHDYYLDKLDIISLKNKLGYLTDNEKMLLKKNDFRTVNSSVRKPNSFMCSLAGIMNKNIETVQTLILGKEKAYDPDIRINSTECLEKLKNRNILKYVESDQFDCVDEMKKYLKANARKFENKHIIIDEMAWEKLSHTLVLKFKLVNDNSDPVLLYIDYMYPGLLRPDFPNPFRFRTYLKTDFYNSYFISVIELLTR